MKCQDCDFYIPIKIFSDIGECEAIKEMFLVCDYPESEISNNVEGCRKACKVGLLLQKFKDEY